MTKVFEALLRLNFVRLLSLVVVIILVGGLMGDENDKDESGFPYDIPTNAYDLSWPVIFPTKAHILTPSYFNFTPILSMEVPNVLEYRVPSTILNKYLTNEELSNFFLVPTPSQQPRSAQLISSVNLEQATRSVHWAKYNSVTSHALFAKSTLFSSSNVTLSWIVNTGSDTKISLPQSCDSSFFGLNSSSTPSCSCLSSRPIPTNSINFAVQISNWPFHSFNSTPHIDTTTSILFVQVLLHGYFELDFYPALNVYNISTPICGVGIITLNLSNDDILIHVYFNSNSLNDNVPVPVILLLDKQNIQPKEQGYIYPFYLGFVGFQDTLLYNMQFDVVLGESYTLNPGIGVTDNVQTGRGEKQVFRGRKAGLIIGIVGGTSLLLIGIGTVALVIIVFAVMWKLDERNNKKKKAEIEAGVNAEL
eukprot:TRINITY_DN9512_c0_g1_i1.p1 TRINITY_DN9512_c0_g1~~TRINITY_DN9512_c0_g1_i1.p1  ORF type:complete len:420 (-),score=82.56 TRINITY_DN9512_c0_g1_i1:265-1524(-)